jgi:serine/threonine protein kinase
LLEKIGEGGVGVVYRAEDTAKQRQLAVKLLLPGLGSVDEIAMRFEREAQAATASARRLKQACRVQSSM